MSDHLELGYSPRRGLLIAVIVFFGSAGILLGWVGLADEDLAGHTAWRIVLSGIALLALVLASTFVVIMVRSGTWLLRVDDAGISVDTLAWRRFVAWPDLQGMQVQGEGRLRGLLVSGRNSSLGVNAAMMSDPAQFEAVVEAVRAHCGGVRTS